MTLVGTVPGFMRSLCSAAAFAFLAMNGPTTNTLPPGVVI